jgi:hypothetical protein
MDKKTPNSDLIELVEKLLNEALKKKKKAEKKSKDEDKDEKKADKDYDGDGEVESSKDEYFGSKDKAIKKAMGKKEVVSKKKKKKLEEGRIVGNEQLIYGGFPRIINVVLTEQDQNISELQTVSLKNHWGGNPVEYDLTSDEGLIEALKHIQATTTVIDAADSPKNIRPSEKEAHEHNSQFLPALEEVAKRRGLKVTHQGIGGNWTRDYGKA